MVGQFTFLLYDTLVYSHSRCITSRMLMYICTKNCELSHRHTHTHTHLYILKAVVEIKTVACNCSLIVSSQLPVSTCRTALL